MITTSGGPPFATSPTLLDRLGVHDLDVAEGLFEDGSDPGPDDRMVIHDQAARRSLRAGGIRASIPRIRVHIPDAEDAARSGSDS